MLFRHSLFPTADRSGGSAAESFPSHLPGFARAGQLILALAALAAPPAVFSWGEPHQAITAAALERLPPWQREVLGAEFVQLADRYCTIPDRVFADKEDARFAAMDSKPGEVYLKILHLPEQQPQNLATMGYFLGKAVAALREDRTGDAARYLGTLAHQIEDYGCPAHVLPGDNMFTLLQQFVPPTGAMKHQLLHGPIETGDWKVAIADYKPELLGTSPGEAAWRLMHRVHAAILNARKSTIPIMQALDAGDEKSVRKWQMQAAVMDAQIVADAIYTVLCIGRGQVEGPERDSLKAVAIGTFWPLEAESLYYPQSQFFSSPFWGYPSSGFALAEGKNPVPLKLRMEDAQGVKEVEFADGISAGMGRSLTFLLPEHVYSRFQVTAGLLSGLGATGRVEFSIRSAGDGRVLGSAIIGGEQPALAFDCDISGVTQLQLSLTAKGGDVKSNYAVWGGPVLRKP